MKTQPSIIRQGDVLLVRTEALPSSIQEVPLENGRIVLMHGEVTGHAHAISNHGWDSAKRMADTAMGLAGRRARLLIADDGRRYLEVAKTVNLTHEEHTAHEVFPGIYEIPVQMEHTSEHMVRQVAD